MSHKSSKYLALGGMLILLVLYAITNAGLLGDNPVGSTSRDTSPLIVPAGYAFAIWGPIYLGLIAFPIYQL
ncbi:MAG: tryptophan-rich sensory protein, partial [Bacteroidota bacterium]